MELPYQAVIFDLDGVLCSTDQYHYQAWKCLADRLQIPFDETVNQRLRGVSRRESLEIILSGGDKTYSEEEKQQFAAEKNAHYVESLQQLTPKDLACGAVEVLERLHGAGVKIAVGSSSRNTQLILQRLGLDQRFDAVADGTQITHSKPDPEVFLLAARLVGVEPQHCLVVEDAKAGLEAAKAGSMDAAGIGGAAQDPLADYALSVLSDLLPICRV